MKPLSLVKPHAILIVGIPGAGKTSFAEKFSETFGAPFINAKSIQLKIEETDAANSLAASEAITEEIFNQFLRSRNTIVIESPLFYKKSIRNNYFKLAKKSGYIPIVIWVQTDQEESKRRSTKTTGLKKAKHPISVEEFENQVSKFTEPSSAENPIVISGKHTFSTQIRSVLRKLGRNSSTGKEAPKQVKSSIKVPTRSEIQAKKSGSIKIQ